MKTIEFQLADKKYTWIDNPIPAVNNVPDWYKNMKAFSGEKGHVISNRKTNQTAKRCVPLFEAMTSGYYITLPADMVISVDKETGQSSFEWLSYTDLVTAHDPMQTIEIPFTQEYSPVPFKFYNHFIIKTPPGYSCLFISPLMRPDIPFYTLPGVVDTDKHDVPVHFPFLIRRDFEGLIEKGTPIIQVIPFKRNDWKLKINEPINDLFQRLEKYYSFTTRAYKKLGVWSRKRYE